MSCVASVIALIDSTCGSVEADAVAEDDGVAAGIACLLGRERTKCLIAGRNEAAVHPPLKNPRRALHLRIRQSGASPWEAVHASSMTCRAPHPTPPGRTHSILYPTTRCSTRIPAP